ncbi:MAG: hypothetical protein EPN79_11820 [Burkholderiaceae bacterium]|nr:MAG: hypothetical protein EPN79_11820 [Burkholderiaceae bacterium]
MSFVTRLIKTGLPYKMTSEHLAEINAWAHSMTLGDCGPLNDTDSDPFAPEGTPPPPLVYNCTWENGAGVSFTRVANTGAWRISDDATAAQGAGAVLDGKPREEEKVVSVPILPSSTDDDSNGSSSGSKPIQSSQPEAASPPAPTYLTASRFNSLHSFSPAELMAMPSPYIPPSAAPAATSRLPGANSQGNAGQMPTPFARRAK